MFAQAHALSLDKTDQPHLCDQQKFAASISNRNTAFYLQQTSGRLRKQAHLMAAPVLLGPLRKALLSLSVTVPLKMTEARQALS